MYMKFLELILFIWLESNEQFGSLPFGDVLYIGGWANFILINQGIDWRWEVQVCPNYKYISCLQWNCEQGWECWHDGSIGIWGIWPWSKCHW